MTAIQPCALLLLVGPDWRVETISANAGHAGRVESLQRSSAGRWRDLIGSKAIHALRNRMAWLAATRARSTTTACDGGDVRSTSGATATATIILIEAELSVEPRLPDGIGMAQSMMDRMTGNDSATLPSKAMRQLCALTGYNRLMLCGRDGTIVASGQPHGFPLIEPSWPEAASSPHHRRPRCRAGAVDRRRCQRSARALRIPCPRRTAKSRRLADWASPRPCRLPVRIDGELVGAVHAHHAIPAAAAPSGARWHICSPSASPRAWRGTAGSLSRPRFLGSG